MTHPSTSDPAAVLPVALAQALHDPVQRALSCLTDPISNERRLQWMRVLACSSFVGWALERVPGVQALLDAELSWRSDQLRAALRAEWTHAQDEAELYRCIRRFRHRHMARIIWMDLNTPADAWAVSAEVTRLAEVVLDETLHWLSAFWAPRWGLPSPDASGHVPQLVVLGMGKLGAGELNLSSDIDLIFAYAQEGETCGGRRRCSYIEYFTKLGQALIAALDSTTEEGIAFRVDMRLRPFGDGGSLVGSFNTLERYYQRQGREWERYAMLKARPVAGDIAGGQALLTLLRPFVYRRYIDFGVIDALRDLKRRIQREVRRQAAEDDIKLGRGGIREVEFIVQALQLVHGGRDKRLQTTSLRHALDALDAAHYLEHDAATSLMADYVWLRDLEHALQAQDDTQTQRLPACPLKRARLAYAMHEDTPASLLNALDQVRQRVRARFDDIITESPDEALPPSTAAPWDDVWVEGWSADQVTAVFQRAGFTQPAQAHSRLSAFRDSPSVAHMQAIGIERLDALMPLLLRDLAEATPGHVPRDVVLNRVLMLVEAVSRRTAYLVLLKENASARTQLLTLCAASPWIAEQLAHYPVLLDELLDPEALHAPLSRTVLEDELHQTLLRLPLDDDEAQLTALCQLKLSQVLRVAVSDLFGLCSLMSVSDALTWVAEVILMRVVSLAWHALLPRYGAPEPLPGHDEAGFIVVAYGKLGSIELGYGSDLDLVFVHDAAPQGVTQGPRQIDNAVFMARLGQKIIHLLTAVTPTGSLYDVDVRLRPSGSAGLLVTSFDAFEEYQQRQAWLWEHQALVKARPITGPAGLQGRFTAFRERLLGQPRDPDTVKRAVAEMRQRMQAHQAPHPTIKQVRGGLVDIEFIVQYVVLTHAHEYPVLLDYTDNVRLLAMISMVGILDATDAQCLIDTLLEYRQALHTAALMLEPVPLPADSASAREAVARLWQRVIGDEPIR